MESKNGIYTNYTRIHALNIRLLKYSQKILKKSWKNLKKLAFFQFSSNLKLISIFPIKNRVRHQYIDYQ